MKEFNINNFVYVKLTEVGKEELEKQYDQLKKTFPSMPEYKPIKEVDGWSKWQMHNLISNLGHLIGLTRDLPFETTIRFDEIDLKPYDTEGN